jgi:hypothetical protein
MPAIALLQQIIDHLLKKNTMKKVFISSLGLLLAVATTQAQADYSAEKQDLVKDKQEETITKKEKREERRELRKLEGPGASYQSKQSFFQDFGDLPDVAWERTPAFDEATFTKDGQEMKAFYDFHAELVGTIVQKTFADLPMAAQQYIHQKYNDYEARKVFLFDDNEFNESDMLLYNQQFEDADSYFVEVVKGDKRIVLQVSMGGQVSYFTALR